ncbi:MAG: WecB/TagA/CpsF family glycosyltransferase [Lachnospiraceae bacterium]|nr:WecB/TagA/CpsF family glycosyltransferase [Lachnospiraceae bacterium]
MKRLSVMGIRLKDYSVRESMRRINTYLNNDKCNTIDFVTHDLLLNAAGSEELKKEIENMDMTLMTTADILVAGGVESYYREREILSNLFLKALFRKFEKEKRKIYLVSENADKMAVLKEGIERFSTDLEIEGEYITEEKVGGDDAIVNDINSTLPEVVLLNLSSPSAEKFVIENRSRMNVKFVMILRDQSLKTTEDGRIKKGGLGGFFIRKFFHSAVANYERSAEIDQLKNNK